MTEEGFLIISDITGYSAYVNQSELEHARDSLADLLNLLIGHTRSPLVISKLEGDAVFSYAISGGFLGGQTLLEMVETIYAAFRKALELMVINTSCTCKACANLSNLDLKFFLHYGTFSLQKLGVYRELVGNDVNLVHRLVKNHIVEETGLKAYAVYTQAVIDILAMEDQAQYMIPHRESFSDVGEVQLYVQDLHGVWANRKDELRLTVEPEDAIHILEWEFPIPPPLLWEYITNPATRSQFIGSDSQNISGKSGGRIGEGTVYVCAHGDSEVRHLVLDWEPFEQYTFEQSSPLPNLSCYYTFRLDPIDGGTHLRMLFGQAKGSFFIRKLYDFLSRPLMSKTYNRTAELLRQRIEQDLSQGMSAFSPAVRVGEEQVNAATVAALTGSIDTGL